MKTTAVSTPPDSTYGAHDCSELLPGIHNDVVLQHIAPKLAWRDCVALTLVSRSWRDAIETREVYDARVYHNGTEAFVLVQYILRAPYLAHVSSIPVGESKVSYIMALCSLKDNSVYELPVLYGKRRRRFPRDRGIPVGSQCVALDGKVYVFGGYDHKASVLDMAGDRQWRACKPMRTSKVLFAMGVMGGKIYKFGGFVNLGYVRESEVYDPKANTWSPIKPMTSLQDHHSVVAMGEELVVYGGKLGNHRSEVVQIYHPGKDEWRVVEMYSKFSSEWLYSCGVLFSVDGKLYCMQCGGIAVYNSTIEQKSWEPQQISSFKTIAGVLDCTGPVVLVDDELVAMVKFRGGPDRVLLIRSTGFNRGRCNIVWEEAKVSLHKLSRLNSVDCLGQDSMHLVRL